MKHIYHVATIPAGRFLIVSCAGGYRGLSYLDFCDKIMIYRYFSAEEARVERVPAREAQKLKKSLPAITFGKLLTYGTWR